jgi:perosamine synthetase
MSDVEPPADERVGRDVRSDTVESPTDRPTAGPGGLVAGFETATAAAVGVDFGLATATATGGLRLALQAVGVEAGDRVFVPALAPESTVAAVLDVGATPVVVDVNPVTYTIGSFSLEAASEEVADVTAVVAVHAAGQPAEMHRVRDIARVNDLSVIEDARGAAGAAYQGRQVGTFGDVGCFHAAFGATEATADERAGGVVVTDEGAIARTARTRQGSAGTAATRAESGTAKPDTARAVAGLDALRRCETALGERRRLVDEYEHRLSGVECIGRPQPRRDTVHAFTQYVVDTPDRDGLRETLETLGVAASPVTAVVDRAAANCEDSCADGRVRSAGSLPVATRLGERLLALPLSSATERSAVKRACLGIETHCRRLALGDNTG